MNRRQIHAYGLAALLLLVVALCIALAMLANATMSGGPQWSAGALFGTAAAGMILLLIVLTVGSTILIEAIDERRRTRRRHRHRDRPAYRGAPHWAVDVEQATAAAVVAAEYAVTRSTAAPALPAPDPATRLDLPPAATQQQPRITVHQAPPSITAARPDRSYAQQRRP